MLELPSPSGYLDSVDSSGDSNSNPLLLDRFGHEPALVACAGEHLCPHATRRLRSPDDADLDARKVEIVRHSHHLVPTMKSIFHNGQHGRQGELELVETREVLRAAVRKKCREIVGGPSASHHHACRNERVQLANAECGYGHSTQRNNKRALRVDGNERAVVLDRDNEQAHSRHLWSLPKRSVPDCPVGQTCGLWRSRGRLKVAGLTTMATWMIRVVACAAVMV